jgi:hypothetical protein
VPLILPQTLCSSFSTNGIYTAPPFCIFYFTTSTSTPLTPLPDHKGRFVDEEGVPETKSLDLLSGTVNGLAKLASMPFSRSSHCRRLLQLSMRVDFTLDRNVVVAIRSFRHLTKFAHEIFLRSKL